jgi:hypothetical protein
VNETDVIDVRDSSVISSKTSYPEITVARDKKMIRNFEQQQTTNNRTADESVKQHDDSQPATTTTTTTTADTSITDLSTLASCL